jgi:hypothetical protein
MKKNYQLSLEKEKVEELKEWLAPKKITFSGYVNSLICEQMDAVREFKIPANVSEMKLAEFAKMFKNMAVSLAKEARKKK